MEAELQNEIIDDFDLTFPTEQEIQEAAAICHSRIHDIDLTLTAEEEAWFLEAYNANGDASFHPELKKELQESRERDEQSYIPPIKKKSPKYLVNTKGKARRPRRNQMSKRALAIRAQFGGVNVKANRNLLSDLEEEESEPDLDNTGDNTGGNFPGLKSTKVSLF